MLKALYYPYTEIGSDIILKNALLLWDKMETIVPNKEWKPLIQRDEVLEEALELVVEPRVPTGKERQKAHKVLSELVENGFVSSLVRNSPAQWRTQQYLVYPEKFSAETWGLLQQGGMAQWVQHEQDYGVPAAVGFLMMSLLADECAGTQIRKVTDRTDAYSWLAQMHAKSLGSKIVSDLSGGVDHDCMVSMSMEVLDGREIPLAKLVEMRKREAKSGGSDYRALRRRYLSALEGHLARIGKEAKSDSDLKELNRQFKEDMKVDLSDLKAELGLAGKKALVSKEVVISTLILAGTVISPLGGLSLLATQLGGASSVIPLVKAAVEYRGVRREILRKHTMSWLYLGTSRRLSLY